jgi:outer membrane lipoprotein-sorting protein
LRIPISPIFKYQNYKVRNLFLFALLILLLLVVQFSAAKTVDEVIDKYIRARGGRNKLAAIKSIYMEGSKEMNGGEVQVKIIKEQDKLSRTEIESNVVVITTEEIWTFFPDVSPAPNRIPIENLKGIQPEMDIAGPLVDYVVKGHKTELLGKEVLEGNNCYKIKLTTHGGKIMMFWIDVSTNLLLQSSALSIDYGYSESLVTYSNYKEVDGIQFAHTFETISNKKMNDVRSREIVIHTIHVNPEILPAMYQPNIQS